LRDDRDKGREHLAAAIYSDGGNPPQRQRSYGVSANKLLPLTTTRQTTHQQYLAPAAPAAPASAAAVCSRASNARHTEIETEQEARGTERDSETARQRQPDSETARQRDSEAARQRYRPRACRRRACHRTLCRPSACTCSPGRPPVPHPDTSPGSSRWRSSRPSPGPRSGSCPPSTSLPPLSAVITTWWRAGDVCAISPAIATSSIITPE
jgi:hypothetical protein